MMRDFTDKCIVLRISEYRDDDRLADVLTAANGLVGVQFRGVKKAKAKLKPFAQCFAVFDARLTSTRGKFLTPVEPMLIQDGFGLCSDLKIFTAASVAAEATVRSICDDEPHTDMFVEFLRLVRALQSDGDPYYCAAAYMCALLKMSGFYRDYTYSDDPKRYGYEPTARPDYDLARRALKYACGEFSRNFDIALKSADSIDLYAD